MGKNSQKTFIKKSTLGRALYKSRFSQGDATAGNSERWNSLIFYYGSDQISLMNFL